MNTNCNDMNNLLPDSDQKWFLPYQRRWIRDASPLKIMEKSRQVGISFADAYHSVKVASNARARYDVFVSTRDKFQARLYIEDCKNWAEVLEIVLLDLGEILFDREANASAYVLQFSNGKRIYALSSNPNALAGKRGHVKLDEFALHEDQRLLYRIAKPVTTWGGSLSIISTHRGADTVFNQIIRDILERDNPMGWKLHRVCLDDAIREGLVEKINEKTGGHETRAGFHDRLQVECLDEEQWKQEYCCIPADENSAFFSYEMIGACEDQHLKTMTFEQLLQYIRAHPHCILYIGVDVARKHNLCVIDVGEKIGDVVWDRMRVEMRDKTFAEIEWELNRLLRLDQVKRCCIDATGLGMQLAEEAQFNFGWKVEPLTFTAPLKEELAFGLRRDFEERRLRIPRDEQLRSDLRGLKKQVTSSGSIRFAAESQDSNCDRTWAKALRQLAARNEPEVGAMVG